MHQHLGVTRCFLSDPNYFIQLVAICPYLSNPCESSSPVRHQETRLLASSLVDCEMCWHVKVYWRVLSNFSRKLSRDVFDYLLVKLVPVTRHVATRVLRQNRQSYQCSCGLCCDGNQENNPKLMTVSGESYRDIERQPYFFNVDRTGAEELLVHRKPGQFLVRPYCGEVKQIISTLKNKNSLA